MIHDSMNNHFRFFASRSTALFASAFLGGVLVLAAPPDNQPPKSEARGTNSYVVPQSAFVIPNNFSEGRDPFFPNRLANTGGADSSKSTAPVTELFILNGLSGPRGARLAIINSRTFAEGEEASVTTSAGRTPIRCIEIKTDSVIIEVAGERRELRLRD